MYRKRDSWSWGVILKCIHTIPIRNLFEEGKYLCAEKNKTAHDSLVCNFGKYIEFIQQNRTEQMSIEYFLQA